MRNKRCIFTLIMLWIVLLLGLLLLDVLVLQDTQVKGHASLRLTAIPTNNAAGLNEGMTYEDACSKLGFPTGSDRRAGSIRLSWDLEWGRTLWVTFMPSGKENVVAFYQITEPLTNFRWLVIPAIMMLAALVEVCIYRFYKRRIKYS